MINLECFEQGHEFITVKKMTWVADHLEEMPENFLDCFRCGNLAQENIFAEGIRNEKHNLEWRRLRAAI